MAVPQGAQDAVLQASQPMPEGSVTVEGYDFNKGVDYHALLQSFKRTGFQATNFGKAVEEVQRMLEKRAEPIAEPEPDADDVAGELDAAAEAIRAEHKPKTNCTVFLGFTSNMISSGVRDTLRYLVQHKLVDVVVTTAGGIEEDFIQCLAPTYLGDFHLRGAELRDKGINRIGNLLVPNSNYCLFEDWIMPILDQMVVEQTSNGTLWTPSKVIARLGKEINNPDSVYYWAWKNDIPVYSPALTDGSIGDMIYFHSFKKPGLVLDIVQDIRSLNSTAVHAKNTGMVILGGGLIKHHICNANLMRNGADFAVFINTAQEFDGSDSGARPDEAVSWGEIKKLATPVKVYGEASILFPLLVAETFARVDVSKPSS
eukprot:scpid30782/ scgid19221/ Deoxyhypusine synthase